MLHALDATGVPQHLNRVLGTDTDGILYIGQTTKQTFKIRIDMLKRVMNPTYAATPHSGALNLKEIPALRLRFPVETLFVSIHPTSTPQAEEKRLIEQYRQQFGEVPPLNGSK